MDEFVREFLVESYENLDQLDQDLVALEGKPGSREPLSRVFRTIHTIKGTCGFLAFSRLESLTHAGESLLAELRDGNRAMSTSSAGVLLKMVDTVREILASIEATGGEGDIAVDAVIAAIEVVLQEPAPKAPSAVDIPAAITGLVHADPPTAARSVDPAPAVDKPGASGDRPEPVHLSETSIRVEIDVLDALMRQVGELVLARNQIARLVVGQRDSELIRASQRLTLISSELHEGVIKARMQPIGRLWAQMPRVVRNLAAVCGRQVRLVVVGGDTELDRALVEVVKDPLMHLVRNAVDHGIEDAETRVAAGKPAEGVLTIRAYHAGGQIVVEVGDDGKGIDADGVAATAVALGVRTPSQIAMMGSADLLQLLFVPGFSTAESLTTVSGRGIGMDVVRSKIVAIGGTVEVESSVGRGTTWRLRIPLTLAIISALIVEADGELYAIPAANVLEFVAPDVESAGPKIEYVGGVPVLRRRGSLLPLLGLTDVLGLTDTPDVSQQGSSVIAVLQANSRRFGLIVSRVLDTEEIVVMPLSARLTGIGMYGGATLLGDGRVSLILDVQGIARMKVPGQGVEAEVELSVRPSMPLAPTGQVLVVGVAGGQRVAIPLEVVTRLERVRGDLVECVAGAEVIQYRRAVVPLARLDRLISARVDPAADLAADLAEDLDGQDLLVVMFTRGARTVAVVVTEVLDILDDDVTQHSQFDEHGVAGSTVLEDRVTQLLDVSRVVLSADPLFFDDDEVTFERGADARPARLRSVGA